MADKNKKARNTCGGHPPRRRGVISEGRVPRRPEDARSGEGARAPPRRRATRRYRTGGVGRCSDARVGAATSKPALLARDLRGREFEGREASRQARAGKRAAGVGASRTHAPTKGVDQPRRLIRVDLGALLARARGRHIVTAFSHVRGWVSSRLCGLTPRRRASWESIRRRSAPRRFEYRDARARVTMEPARRPGAIPLRSSDARVRCVGPARGSPLMG